MRLTNGDHAVVDIRKLRDYCLDLNHPEGRHKAQVFASALDMAQEDAMELQVALLAAARNDDAQPAGTSEYGALYRIEFYLTRRDKKALIRSGWIVRLTDGVPHLTTVYVRAKGAKS